jgi:hypothetical protein
MTLSMRIFRQPRQDDAREAVDEQKRNAEEQPPPRSPDDVAGVLEQRAETLSIHLPFCRFVGH